MKKLHNIKLTIACICCFSFTHSGFGQEANKPELIVHLEYFTTNNSLQYLRVQTQVKADNKLQPAKDVALDLYLDTISAANSMGHLKTNDRGIAETQIPIRLKDQWNLTPNHTFIAENVPTKQFDKTTTELQIAKAKIVIGTLNNDGAKQVTAQVLSYYNGVWIPEKDVEVKLGVKRLGGNLKIGEDETYTTDSLGAVSGEFKLDSLPAIDTKNNITLIATIDDNDKFGNLSIEKKVPWGKYYVRESKFGQRSLWATRTRTPIWLLFMAYSIIAAVWSVIIYLLFQIFQIKKLGSPKTKVARQPAVASSLN